MDNVSIVVENLEAAIALFTGEHVTDPYRIEYR